eukprot:111613-Chlamydomonas_euryale.AAC.2
MHAHAWCMRKHAHAFRACVRVCTCACGAPPSSSHSVTRRPPLRCRACTKHPSIPEPPARHNSSANQTLRFDFWCCYCCCCLRVAGWEGAVSVLGEGGRPCRRGEASVGNLPGAWRRDACGAGVGQVWAVVGRICECVCVWGGGVACIPVVAGRHLLAIFRVRDGGAGVGRVWVGYVCSGVEACITVATRKHPLAIFSSAGAGVPAASSECQRSECGADAGEHRWHGGCGVDAGGHQWHASAIFRARGVTTSTIT